MKTEPYKATVRVMGKTFTSTGTSSQDAVFKLKPGNCKGKGILTIEKGKVSRERILMPDVTFRLFNTTGVSKEVALKNIGILFDI